MHIHTCTHAHMYIICARIFAGKYTLSAVRLLIYKLLLLVFVCWVLLKPPQQNIWQTLLIFYFALFCANYIYINMNLCVLCMFICVYVCLFCCTCFLVIVAIIKNQTLNIHERIAKLHAAHLLNAVCVINFLRAYLVCVCVYELVFVFNFLRAFSNLYAFNICLLALKCFTLCTCFCRREYLWKFILY